MSTPDLAALYQYTVQTGHLELEKAADVLDWTLDRARNAAETLTHKALLRPTPHAPGCFSPVSPSSAAAHLVLPLMNKIEQYENQANLLRQDLSEFTQIYQKAAQISGGGLHPGGRCRDQQGNHSDISRMSGRGVHRPARRWTPRRIP